MPCATWAVAPVLGSVAVAEISHTVSLGTGGQLNPLQSEKPGDVDSPKQRGTETLTIIVFVPALVGLGVTTVTGVTVVGAGAKFADVLMNLSIACSAAFSMIFSFCWAATDLAVIRLVLIIEIANTVIMTNMIRVMKRAEPRLLRR